MASRDFYDILGVGRKATADEIRAAYRKLARQFHPDVNKSADAQKRFTEVQNAYDALSDDKKRAMYDQFGSAAFETGSSQEAASRARAGPHYGWENVGGRRGGGSVHVNGGDFDPEDISSIFESVFGGGGFGGQGSVASGDRGGAKKRGRKVRMHEAAEPIARDVEVEFLTAARGGVQTLRFAGGGSTRTVEVTIPAGIETGQQLRIRGGENQPEVLLTIKVGAHAWFRRGEFEHTGKGLDVFVDVPISIAEATLGASVAVPTLDGRVDVSIPPGTPSGRKLRLREQGIRDAAGRVGDLYVMVKIVTPSGATLSPTEADQLRSIAAKVVPHRPW